MLPLRIIQVAANGDRTLFEHLVQQIGFRAVKGKSIEGIAAIMEDTSPPDTSVEYNHYLTNLKKIAANFGYVITAEGLDQHPGTDYNPIKGQLNHPENEQQTQQPEEDEEETSPPQ